MPWSNFECWYKKFQWYFNILIFFFTFQIDGENIWNVLPMISLNFCWERFHYDWFVQSNNVIFLLPIILIWILKKLFFSEIKEKLLSWLYKKKIQSFDTFLIYISHCTTRIVWSYVAKKWSGKLSWVSALAASY